jgi:hypothetical protein
LAVLSIDLEAKLARLENDLGRATKIIERQAGQMDRAFSKAGDSLRNLTGMLSGAVVGTFLVQFTRNTIESIDRMDDLASAVGSTVENISALEDIAIRAGSSLDVVSAAMLKMTSFMADAGPGSANASILARLGLDAKSLQADDPAEAFLKIAAAMQGFAQDANLSQATYAIFGKKLIEIDEVLKATAEKGALNATVTREQADSTKRFNDQLNSLTKNAIDAGRAIAGPLLDGINSGIGRMRAWAAVADMMIGRLAKLAGFSENTGGASGSWDAPETRPSIGPTPDKPTKGGGGARIAKVRDDSERIAKLLLDAEEDAARDASEAWGFWEKHRLDEHKKATDAMALQWKQVFAEIDAEQERAIAEGAAFLDALEAGMKKTDDAAKELGMTFASAFEDAIVGGRSLRDVLKGLDQDITRILLRKLVTEPLANTITGAIGSGGGASGMMASAGSWFSSLFAGLFADGGYIAPGKWGVVGERGPELAFGGRSGQTITPSGMQVTNVFHLSGAVDRRTQQQIAVSAAAGLRNAQARIG